MIANYISQIDLSSLAVSYPLFPKIYLADRDLKQQRLALGSSLTLSSIPCDEDLKLGSFYGAFHFEDSIKDNSPWKDCPRMFFFRPQIEIIIDCEKEELILHGISESNFYDLLKNNPPATPLPNIQSRNDYPSKQDWFSIVDLALDKIYASQLEKVVLARRTSLECKSSISPNDILSKLREKQKNTTVFLLQIQKGVSFLGSTPEKLYTRVGDKIQTEALAGTIPKHGCGKLLLSQAKERSEVSFVENFIEKSLKRISNRIEKDDDFSLFETPNLYHLYKKISCKCSSKNLDQLLIRTLHPTPAVGGLPSDEALEFIRHFEPFSRGYYASCIGYLSKDRSDLSVAIRSMLIEKNSAHLFAGAGIVKGSNPQNEWDELENKITQFMEMFS